MAPLNMLHNIILQLPGVITHSASPHSLPGVIHDRHDFVREQTFNICVCNENEDAFSRGRLFHVYFCTC